MDVNFEYYKAFYHVARLGSLTLAARTMCVTQPALSKAVLQLEKALGCPLFIRRRKGMELTAEGEMLYRHIAQAYEHIDIGEKTLQSMLNLGSGEIHVGSSDMILKSFLLPHLGKFHQKYPDIKLHTHIISAAEAAPMLRNRQIDLAIVTSPVAWKADLQCMAVGNVHEVFVAGEAYRDWKGKTLTLEEAAALPLICPGKNTGARQHFDTFFRRRNILLNPEFELATTILVAPFVAQGLGVGIVAREFVREELQNGALFEISTTESIPPRELSLVILKKNRISRAGKAFLRALCTGADTVAAFSLQKPDRDAGGSSPD